MDLSNVCQYCIVKVYALVTCSTLPLYDNAVWSFFDALKQGSNDSTTQGNRESSIMNIFMQDKIRCKSKCMWSSSWFAPKIIIMP